MGRMTLDEVMELARREHFLAVVATVRADATVQASVVNAGVLPHPLAGEPVVAYVTYGATKLRNLRARAHTAITFRAGGAWATVEGDAELIGPDDPHPDVDDERLRLLLREVFQAAGGTHDDWSAYDRAMREQRRTVVLVTPKRVYSN
jgi:PPOX class probable F420-dependent enzyme